MIDKYTLIPFNILLYVGKSDNKQREKNPPYRATDCFHYFFCTSGETGWYSEIVIQLIYR